MTDESPIAYPEPAGEPGAPFADPNLKLVVLNALLMTKTIQLGPRQRLARFFMGDGYDEERDGYDLLQPVYDYLLRYPLAPTHLAAVDELIFDGGNEIYFYPFPFWDGESDEFDVNSLAGIGQLVNLRRLDVISMLNETDLSPLASLARLEHLDLGYGRYHNTEALRQLPALRTLRGSKRSISDPALVDALRAGGVDVKLA